MLPKFQINYAMKNGGKEKTKHDKIPKCHNRWLHCDMWKLLGPKDHCIIPLTMLTGCKSKQGHSEKNKRSTLELVSCIKTPKDILVRKLEHIVQKCKLGKNLRKIDN